MEGHHRSQHKFGGIHQPKDIYAGIKIHFVEDGGNQFGGGVARASAQAPQRAIDLIRTGFGGGSR